MVSIKIILGSNRPNRFATQPGEWLKEISKQVKGATFDIIDLAEVNLPFLDEPQSPMMGQYQNDHTKQWAQTIGAADGFVFVAPEYNHGYTPVLKNAIDYLYAEWLNKPVAFVSYGAQAGGARAVEQLRQVVGQLSMFDLSEHLLLPDYYTNLDESGAYKFTPQHQQRAVAVLSRLVFWAEKMKVARQELEA